MLFFIACNIARLPQLVEGVKTFVRPLCSFLVLITLSTLETTMFITMTSSVSTFATVFDSFNFKVTRMDTVEGGMRKNIRPSRTIYQKIIEDFQPAVFREGTRKERFSTRIEKCLEADESGRVSIRLLSADCINIEEISFFFLCIFLFFVGLMMLCKLFSWLNSFLNSQNVPFSAVWQNIFKNRIP